MRHVDSILQLLEDLVQQSHFTMRKRGSGREKYSLKVVSVLSDRTKSR